MNEAYLKSDKTSKGDETYTPFYGVEPIIKYLPKDSVIWCPFDEEWSAFPRRLREEGFDVVSSHIADGYDFFKFEPPVWSIIVSNPPYSIKDKVIRRCYELNKPFALLMPIPTIQGERRFKIWGNDIQLLTFDKRINFHTRGNLKTTSDACHFGSGYFCRNVLPEKLIVEELNRYSRPLVEE